MSEAELELRRLEYEDMFKLVNEYIARHPGATEDRAWAAIRLYSIGQAAAILARIEESAHDHAC